MSELTPRQIVAELDRHIVGQVDAKRAVAIALRNRYRWQQLPEAIRRDVTPKNIIMIGPTGVGKTEITRRLAQLTGAPLAKVEATKYTEVGYYGRDVESIIRDLVDNAVKIVKNRKRKEFETHAAQRTEDRLLDLILPTPERSPTVEHDAEETSTVRTREKFRQMLRAGELEDREVELSVEQRNAPVQIFSNMGMEQMDVDLQGMFERLMPKQHRSKQMKVSDARKVLLESEIEALMDKDVTHEEARQLAKSSGIVFIDESDKICGTSEGSRNADVSRQGVQRDLLPIVEGTIVQTRYGSLSTEHILFIAAGAFHRTKPSDLMPELQGRFPIRVELSDLSEADFVRILSEPSGSIVRQYTELLRADGVELNFTPEGLESVAKIAFRVNQSTQNIGARRLHTIMERLLEDISFAAPEAAESHITVDAAYVQSQLESLMQDEDLSKFIL